LTLASQIQWALTDIQKDKTMRTGLIALYATAVFAIAAPAHSADKAKKNVIQSNSAVNCPGCGANAPKGAGVNLSTKINAGQDLKAAPKAGAASKAANALGKNTQGPKKP
jgi:hypothetical protein